MYNPFSNLPSVDHLVEGVDYRIVDWNFADAAPAPDACPEGEKMVFGVCRKVGGSGEKDFDSSKKLYSSCKSYNIYSAFVFL